MFILIFLYTCILEPLTKKKPFFIKPAFNVLSKMDTTTSNPKNIEHNVSVMTDKDCCNCKGEILLLRKSQEEMLKTQNELLKQMAYNNVLLSKIYKTIEGRSASTTQKLFPLLSLEQLQQFEDKLNDKSFKMDTVFFI